MVENIATLTPFQFRDWVRSVVVDEAVFAERESLAAVLASGKKCVCGARASTDPSSPEEPFRLFWDGYWDFAFTLGLPEASLLVLFELCAETARRLQLQTEMPVLTRRMKAIESQRRMSSIGRKVRQNGGDIAINEPEPSIKVRDLSEADFRAFVEKIVNCPLFSARDRVVKVLNTMPPCTTDTPLSTLLSQGLEASAVRCPESMAFIAAEMPLLSAFFAFFVEHLALELFLEDYGYDSDEGLEFRAELLEEIEHNLAEKAAGRTQAIPLAEVAKKFGIELSCMR